MLVGRAAMAVIGEYEGTGRGLAICGKIPELRGAGIRAESEPGQGSTFIVRLPVKQTSNA